MVPWAKDSNIYEVNIRQYTEEGSFLAFSKHLPRLKAMGVEILWLMPITPISQKERLGSLGSYYACSSYTRINPEFGSLNDFKQLVETAHQLGFKLIIDWVANHTGWDHHWTFEHPDWYVKDANGVFTEVNGWKDVIDLDYRQANMRQAMIKAMQYWVRECDIDGFRCDMAHLVPLDFWVHARKECDAIKPLFWLAECDEPAYHQAFDVSYAWNWMHTTEKISKGAASLNDLRNNLHSYSQYPYNATKLYFTSNHDENSWNGTEQEKYGFTAKAWWVFSATWQGIPLIYSGQEIPNQRRLLFFDKDAIDWKQPFVMEPFFQSLLSLRKTNKALSLGETFVLPSDHSGELMGYLRKHGQEVVLVLLNLSNKNALKIRVDHPWLNGLFESLFSDLQYAFQPGESFELMAGDYLVYHLVS
ncbi:MAG: 1,4-alpha-glucan branching protein [Chitinophagaceae bacterium BSSC1]|nr:MAG: 1,4-alpha-glucan branching protein [Chitinophagaceae bacterium BSSC1]